jgi:glyoxalase family protein
MENNVRGIHHITAITGEPQPNIDFYVSVLGLRFVKKTVNFDVPDTYHLYYGDDAGRPGTALTFFSWPNIPKGKRGSGQVSTIAFSVLEDSLDYWRQRLSQYGVETAEPSKRFDDLVLAFNDPDGLPLELVAHASAEKGTYWSKGPVPAQYAIHGFHGVTLSVARFASTERLLTEVMGFQKVGSEGKRARYQAGDDGSGHIVDVLDQPEVPRGSESIGSVHHVAFRTANDEEQLAWRQKLIEQGANVTPVMDRCYFHSIYFREPSGVLFEIATDQPGFTIDEPIEELGTHLKLPPWLEDQRDLIEQGLPPVNIPDVSQR